MQTKTTGGFLSGITFTYGLYAHTLRLGDFKKYNISHYKKLRH